jgi:hypothetical protein
MYLGDRLYESIDARNVRVVVIDDVRRDRVSLYPATQFRFDSNQASTSPSHDYSGRVIALIEYLHDDVDRS